MSRIQVLNKLQERLSVGAFERIESELIERERIESELIERERIERERIERDIDGLVDSFWATHDNQSVMQPTVDLEALCTFHLKRMFIKKNE